MYSRCAFRICPLGFFSFCLYFCCKIYFFRDGDPVCFSGNAMGGGGCFCKINRGRQYIVGAPLVRQHPVALHGGDTPTPCACGKIRCKNIPPPLWHCPNIPPVTLSGFWVASACPAIYPRCIAKNLRQSASWSAMSADSLASSLRSPSVIVSDTCI